MAENLQVNDQVLVRKRIRTGNLIRMGSVLKIDGDKALVQFPIDHTQTVLPISSLEKTSDRFGGYARVQVSAMRRSMFRGKGLV
jgi:hypothetical protein